MPPKRKSAALKFFEKTYIFKDHCLEWTGAKSSNGYGHLEILGKTISAHRFSYQLFYGAVPDGLIIMHTCDNRQCVNPFHLKTGTSQDNMRDMFTKGRNNTPSGETHYAIRRPDSVPKGSKRYNSVLTEEKVIEIRSLRANGWKQKDIAKHFDVTTDCIKAVTQRRTWKHI